MEIKKAKILEVAAVDFTVKNLLLPLIQTLKTSGYKVDISCTKGKESVLLEREGYNFKYVRIDRKFNLFSNLKSISGLYRVMKQGGYDIVHVHTPSAAVLARIAAKLARVPLVIYTAHGFYFHENMPKIEYIFFTNLEKILGRHFTDYIFVQSKEDYKIAKKLRIIDVDKLIWINNGVNLERFNPWRVKIDIVSFKQTLGIPSNGIIVTYIGRFVKEKGILDILEAFLIASKQHSDIYLLLVGDASSDERDKETKQKIRDFLNLEDVNSKIVLTGYREDIPEILKVTNIFVLPSYREGLPRSVIEAMAMSKSVVATNIRGCREEVIDGETGILVPPGDIESLASAILRLYKNSELRERMGINGRKRAEELYDEKKVIEKELLIIDKLSNKVRVGRR
jgi:glycosyltransferase involved in cell wall biosynthesis